MITHVWTALEQKALQWNGSIDISSSKIPEDIPVLAHSRLHGFKKQLFVLLISLKYKHKKIVHDQKTYGPYQVVEFTGMERNSLNFCKAIKQLPSSVIEREKINLRKTSTAKTQ